MRKNIFDRLTTNLDDYVNRSNKSFGTTLFACGNSDCSSRYGAAGRGSIVTTSPSETAGTDKERFVLVDVDDFDDTDVMISDTLAVASAAIKYPPGWSHGAGYLGLWWATTVSGTVDRVYTNRINASSWSPASPNSWNTLDWSYDNSTVGVTATTATSTRPTTVAWRESHPGRPRRCAATSLQTAITGSSHCMDAWCETTRSTGRSISTTPI